MYIVVKYVDTKLQLADGLTKVKTNAAETDRLLGSADCPESGGVLSDKIPASQRQHNDRSFISHATRDVNDHIIEEDMPAGETA